MIYNKTMHKIFLSIEYDNNEVFTIHYSIWLKKSATQESFFLRNRTNIIVHLVIELELQVHNIEKHKWSIKSVKTMLINICLEQGIFSNRKKDSHEKDQPGAWVTMKFPC